MTEARIDAAMTTVRARIAERDRATLRLLAASYERVVGGMAGDLAALEGELEAIQASGRAPSLGRVFRTQRYRALLVQAERAFDGYAAEIGTTLDDGRRWAAFRARADSGALVRAAMGPPPPGVAADALFAVLPDQAILNAIGTTTRGPLAALLDGFGTVAAGELRDAIVTGIAAGQHPRQIARAMRSALGGNLRRAELIARTEVLRAYREASRRQYAANPRLVTGWVWHSALGTRTCASCWALHGSEWPINEPMGTHPACRCALVPKVRTWAELGFAVAGPPLVIRSGSERFAALPAATQRAILGPRAHDAYRSGEVRLEDFVSERRTRDWGTTRSRASLARATEQARDRRGRVAA